jgi:branched-chain amino acid transport system ATP-binding protein
MNAGVAAPPVLAVTRIAKAFGGVHAVRDVSFDVAAGELVALIGPNGAGKTTCFNVINGQLAPDSGEVRLGGARIDGLAPATVAHRGVARTFQVAATFASMTVRENVEMALFAHARMDRDWIERDTPARRDAAGAILARVGVADLSAAHCATLTYGDAKRVELALALAGTPRLLLMDEPTAGMAHAERDTLMAAAADLARRDRVAVLFTEHDMDVVFGHADRIVVLDRGRVIADATPEVVRANANVQAVYLGTPVA